jgi:hypothetical protein
MRYVPDGPEIDSQPHLRLGPAPRERAVPALTLGTEPGIDLPEPLQADTTAGVALQLLRAPAGISRLEAVDSVTSADYSGDRLLAMWALCEPRAALDRAALVEDVARASEFGVSHSEESTRIACFLRCYPDEVGVHDPALLYSTLLPQITRLLDNPREFDLYWIGEYSDVLRANHLLHSGAVQIEDYPELDLTLMETPLRLHDLTRFTAAAMFRLLTVRSENTYTLEYRRESWVQYQPRRPLPRVDLRPLAQRLQLFERTEGRWWAQLVTDPTPRLFLDDGRGVASPSSIDAATVIDEVKQYLQGAGGRPELWWTPRMGLAVHDAEAPR